jgi:hypothetical protein
VPSVRRRDIACAEWPYIRRFEHFLQLLDVVDDAFNVHFGISIANQLCSLTSGPLRRPPTPGDRSLFETTKNMKIEARVSNSGSRVPVTRLKLQPMDVTIPSTFCPKRGTRLQHQWRRTAVCGIGDLLLPRFVSRSSKTQPQRAQSGCRSHRPVRPARRARAGHQLSSKSGRRGIPVGHRRVNSRNGHCRRSPKCNSARMFSSAAD